MPTEGGFGSFKVEHKVVVVVIEFGLQPFIRDTRIKNCKDNQYNATER
jgi:hypothetical protein